MVSINNLYINDVMDAQALDIKDRCTIHHKNINQPILLIRMRRVVGMNLKNAFECMHL